jgi:hypothetical protein
MSSAPSTLSRPLSATFRAPKRISITIPFVLYEYLLAASDDQGRSLSNYAAHLLEASMIKKSLDSSPRS